MPPSPHMPLLALVATASLFLGCGGKRQACDDLVGTINAHQPALSRARETLTEGSPKTLPQFERTLAEARAALESLELDDPHLESLRGLYGDLLERAGEVGRRYAEPSESAEARAPVLREAEEVVEIEHGIVEAINAYCTQG